MKVIACGGTDETYHPLDSCEIYDSKKNCWSNAANMKSKRCAFGAVMLLDGRVLVTGGFDGNYNLNSCEIYDGKKNTWTSAANMGTKRHSHSATTLLDGRVLVAGGKDDEGDYLDTCEIYDPNINSWASCGTIGTKRYDHTASLLPDGRVIVVGGNTGDSNLDSCAMFDPKTNSWSASAAELPSVRRSHASTTLFDGRILILGGYCDGFLKYCEMYDSKTNTWNDRSIVHLMKPLRHHCALTLPNANAFVVGGRDNFKNSLDSCELYNPLTNKWNVTASMENARSFHAISTLLDNDDEDIDVEALLGDIKNAAKTK